MRIRPAIAVALGASAEKAGAGAPPPGVTPASPGHPGFRLGRDARAHVNGATGRAVPRPRRPHHGDRGGVLGDPGPDPRDVWLGALARLAPAANTHAAPSSAPPTTSDGQWAPSTTRVTAIAPTTTA